MDINNNQQINTFIKGMDTDTSDMYMGEGSYRYAENLRVVTDGASNSGELHIIEGTTKISDRDPNEQLLGFTSIRDYEIEVVKSGDTWSIYRSNISDDDTETRVLIAGPFEKRIWPLNWKGKTKPISLVARWESDDNIKLYIANKFTEILSINVYKENQGNDFESLFQASSKMLLPPVAHVTDSKGANIPGVVMQYGYIVYKKRGAASTLSILSQAVSSAVDKITGFAVDENSTNIVEITMPDDIIGKNVRLYRICYSRSGLLPRVDIIYDQLCQLKTINDIGQSLQNVSTAEFIATNKLSFNAENIESKGDYLFAGNVLYNQDETDKLFLHFDARCYSRGSYYVDNGVEVTIGENASDEILANIPDENLRHRQFDTASIEFDPQYWYAGEHGYNGHGLCFNWKYRYEQRGLTDGEGYHEQYGGGISGNHPTPRTYARNEVYRFGVKLYDLEGRASSVKWIADIKMPDYFNPNGDDTMKPYIEISNNGLYWNVNNLSIEFTPIPSDLWNNVYKYEIVQAKRGIADSYKLMQGLSGYPMICGNDTVNQICVPYFLTTLNFYVLHGLIGLSKTINGTLDEGWDWWHDGDWTAPAPAHMLYHQDKESLYFVSPEYVYQPDDIKALLESYKTSITHHAVGIYGNRAKLVLGSVVSTFNGFADECGYGKTGRDLFYVENITSESKDGSGELKIGMFDGTGDYDGAYYLNSLIMSACNYYTPSGDVRETVSYNMVTKDWHDYIFRKTAFFTNFNAKTIKNVPVKNNININSFKCFGPSSPEDVGKDEKCTIKSKFITLKSGKQFYNWTNPALLNPDVYWITDGSGHEDDLREGWKCIVMSAYDEAGAHTKYTWVAASSTWDYSSRRARLGSVGLACTTGVGGSGIIFEIGNQQYSPFPTTFGLGGNIASSSEKEQILSTTITTTTNITQIGPSGSKIYTYKWTTSVADFDIASFDGTLLFDITFEDGTRIYSQPMKGFKSDSSIYFLNVSYANGQSLNIIAQLLGANCLFTIEAEVYYGRPSESIFTPDLDRSIHPILITIYKETGAVLSDTSSSYPPVTVANICKPATPYGGYNVSAIASTQYVGEGFVKSPEDKVNVTMGDNYITMFVCMPYHNFDHAQFDMFPTSAVQYIVPIESTMDLTKTCSNYIQATHASSLPLPGDGTWIQEKPSSNAGRFTQTTDLYLYNTAYSVNPDIITYAGEDTINAADALYDYRIHYSLKKQNNELIDNWTTFKAIDYLDVDSRYGEITSLKLFKDKLIFLQENGAGVLSVNDRIILKDQNSANIIVGNGGVLDRYDYFTTVYGLKPHQRAVEASNDALYWWDSRHKEIINYVDGFNVSLLQRMKNVQDYINNGTESETPSIVYDIDNKEVLFNVVNDESLVYNEQVLAFTAVYKFNPIYYCNLNGDTIITNRWSNEHAGIYKYNSNINGQITLFGENIYPLLKYVVNKDSMYNKVFDIQTFGGRFYKGDKSHLKFDYKTPLKQHSHTDGNSVTDIEYDFRLAIPRNNDDIYGGRMRGKTMQCLIESDSNDIDFSLQYVTTKYRTSWS